MLNRLIDRVVDRILDRLQPVIETQLDDWRADTMGMLRDALPEMAGAVAEQAVKTVFAHTEVDEAADAVADVVQRIVNRIPRIPRLPWEQR